MASRRDELNAYTFARRRTVAAFLKPLQNGSAEDAPRPMKALVPGIVVGALIVAGFGGYGMLKPSAPQGWSNPGEKVLVGSDSTTRYVVLNSTEKDKNGNKTKVKLLHPVLNLASARLLLSPDKFGVLKVDESIMDSSGIGHGPTLGIPYAPDRLPSADDAKKTKTWALCEQPGGGSTRKAQKVVFVLGGKDPDKVHNGNQLKAGETLFVEAPDGGWYLVANNAIAYPIGMSGDQRLPADRMSLLRSVLFGADSQPQKVTADFMDTLTIGTPIDFPTIEGAGTPSGANGVPTDHNTIGTVLVAPDAGGTKSYVVLPDRLAPVSDFTARLLLQGPNADEAYSGVKAAEIEVHHTDVAGATGDDFESRMHWPEEDPTWVNEPDGRKVSCSVFSGTASGAGNPSMSVWAGRDYPIKVTSSGTNAYVTPGSGLFFRRVTTLESNVGSVFLVTDTGLRYSVPVSGTESDGTSGSSGTGGASGTGEADIDSQDVLNESQKRLGYGEIAPVAVPKVWADLLAAGPTLDTESAKQEQNQ